MRTLSSYAPSALISMVLVLAFSGACDGGSGGSGAASNTGGAASTSTVAASTSSTSSGSLCVAADCDDGIACTIDACKADGTCLHVVGPNTGPTACPPAQYCELLQGCVPAPPCTTDQNCKQAWQSDVCKAAPKCDLATSSCTFTPLDKDADGHAALACGGDDCNDAKASIHPGAPESPFCDGIDSDCDGNPDNVDHASNIYACGSCGVQCNGPLATCENGTCACSGTLCGTECVDLLTDPGFCGDCNTACSGAACTNGACDCGPGLTYCPADFGCYALDQDVNHCGSCATACGPTQHCDASKCCESFETNCGGTCTWVLADAQNCGMCGHVCLSGQVCVNGGCGMGAGTGAGTGAGGGF